MPDQKTYGRFTPSAWNLIKSAKLTEEEQDKMRLMIEAKTETITFEETKAILYAVVIYKLLVPCSRALMRIS